MICKSETFEYAGETFEARELSYAKMRAMQAVKKEGGDMESAVIAASIFKADGSPVFKSAAEVGDAPGKFVLACVSAMEKVTGEVGKAGAGAPGKPKAPRSRRKTG